MPSKIKPIDLSPPPSMSEKFMPMTWCNWFNQIFDRVGNGPFMIQGYSRASLVGGAAAAIKPTEWASLDSSNAFTSLVFVYDEATGVPCLAYSNGTNWLRVHDNVIVV